MIVCAVLGAIVGTSVGFGTSSYFLGVAAFVFSTVVMLQLNDITLTLEEILKKN